MAATAVLVTGASTGIGQAVALLLAERGLDVLATVRDLSHAAPLTNAFPRRVQPVLLDLTDGATIAELSRNLPDLLGERRLAGLVNNAGICVGAPLECLPLDQLRRQLEVNLVGPLALTQLLLPLLREARGRIVNVGSICGRIPAPYLGAYCASKFALRAMTDVRRMELRPWGIHVSLVEPGSVATPIWAKSIALSRALADEPASTGSMMYSESLAALHAGADAMGRRGLPPRRVAQAVLHALTARRPRHCYRLGQDALVAPALKALLPLRWFEWIIRRYFGMPGG